MNPILELNKFSKIFFKEEDHTYWSECVKFPVSVTGFLHKFQEPFDADYWSDRKARERGVDQSVVLSEWDATAKTAQVKGTAFHKFVEDYFAQKSTTIPQRELMVQFAFFYNLIANKLLPVKMEIVLGDRDYQIAGCADALFWSPSKNEYFIFDWKTNKEIKTKNNYGKRLLEPFGDLDDCEFSIYSLQLSLYKLIVEKNTNLKISGLRFVHFNEKNEKPKVYTCLDLSERLKGYLDETVNNRSPLWS